MGKATKESKRSDGVYSRGKKSDGVSSRGKISKQRGNQLDSEKVTKVVKLDELIPGSIKTRCLKQLYKISILSRLIEPYITRWLNTDISQFSLRDVCEDESLKSVFDYAKQLQRRLGQLKTVVPELAKVYLTNIEEMVKILCDENLATVLEEIPTCAKWLLSELDRIVLEQGVLDKDEEANGSESSEANGSESSEANVSESQK